MENRLCLWRIHLEIHLRIGCPIKSHQKHKKITTVERHLINRADTYPETKELLNNSSKSLENPLKWVVIAQKKPTFVSNYSFEKLAIF